jgi:hypothetical protein
MLENGAAQLLVSWSQAYLARRAGHKTEREIRRCLALRGPAALPAHGDSRQDLTRYRSVKRSLTTWRVPMPSST